jgi:hypothetical protein
MHILPLKYMRNLISKKISKLLAGVDRKSKCCRLEFFAIYLDRPGIIFGGDDHTYHAIINVPQLPSHSFQHEKMTERRAMVV